ncbi:helix-turn-helix transcriptional regulator [Lichenifustis flavocetrariae]|uniref:Helix-turn-helix transcriptional regulator n=1 Tax=Lichenifustis flavocetrariae TaxID=2949735 RepID=A0AA41Z014_9HYPH|nr:helix-turn-helix transcriptional regulator [Lichenifustis flavocetrariae]MCW6511706.1 helix-turn-helix transcriptional regulator [Lichenifustis flavocetrariae]
MSAAIDAERFSMLVSLIYDAAISPTAWPAVLDAIRTELNFGNATLSIQSLPSGELLLNETANIPQQYLARMADYGPEVLDQWGGLPVLMRLPLDQPAVLSRINPAAVQFDVTTNRYSLEWARPQGLVDVLAIPLARDERAVGSVAFGRHESAGPIASREIEVACLLIPHLQRAATIARMLDLAVLAQSTFSAVIDTLSAPVLLVASDLRLIHANPTARQMLRAADLIRARDGFIVAVATGVSRAIAAAVLQAARDESALGRKGLGIPVTSDDGRKGALHVLPLRRSRMTADGRAVAAIFVAQADHPFVPPTEVVAALFGLTPAESRVFEHVVAGRTVGETALALGAEIATVKSHLQRIFSKTGVRRQLDLARIAYSLAAPSTIL